MGSGGSDQRDTGLSSTRLKQLTSLTKNNLEMLDDTFGTLVTPTFQQLQQQASTTTTTTTTNQSQILPPLPQSILSQQTREKTIPGFPQQQQQPFQPRKKLDDNFSLLQLDASESTSSSDTSSGSDTFTANTSMNKSINNSFSTTYDSPVHSSASSGGGGGSKGTKQAQQNNTLFDLDDLLSGFNSPAPAAVASPPAASSLSTTRQQPVFTDLDHLINSAPSVVNQQKQQQQPHAPSLPTFTPPPVPPPLMMDNPTNLTIAPPRGQTTRQQPQQLPQQQPEKKSVPLMPAFDPSQILKKFEERAQVIYLTAVVREKIEVVYHGLNRTRYQLVGEVMVKPFSSDLTHGLSQHDFVLSLSKTDKIASLRCNPKYCQQIRDEYNFNCSVPTAEVSKAPVVLLRYKIHDNMCPMPIVFQPKFRVQDSVMTLMVRYKINPETPLKNLSILVQPVTKDHSSQELNVLAAQSKPEGRWTQQQQKLLWRIQDAKFDPEQKQGETLVAKFKMNRNPLEVAQYCPGPILIKLNNDTHVFSGVYVEGGDSKRNAVTNQVFVGGCEYGVEITDFQLILTQDHYLAQ